MEELLIKVASRLTTTYRKKPVNLRIEDEHLFRHEYEKPFLFPTLSVLNNIYVSHLGVMFTRFGVLDQSFGGRVNPYYSTKINQFKFVLRHLLVSKVHRYETGVWLTDNWSQGYFHWFCDVLPKLELLVAHKSAVVYLPPFYAENEYIKESIKFFPEFRFRFLKKNITGHFREIYMPSFENFASGNYNDEIMQRLSARFRKPFDSIQAEGNYRIYISRSKASRRKVLNEEELIPILSEHGFAIKNMEDYPWLDQVQMFVSCRVLMSIHGAGLTNILFMDPGSTVIELRRKDDDKNNCYFSLASSLDINYHYHLCTKSLDSDEDINIDVKELQQFLNQDFPRDGNRGVAS